MFFWRYYFSISFYIKIFSEKGRLNIMSNVRIILSTVDSLPAAESIAPDPGNRVPGQLREYRSRPAFSIQVEGKYPQ